ncbi:hypothetical protein IT157_03045 [bacterium]|nr:hypothetical protein [bacterium]
MGDFLKRARRRGWRRLIWLTTAIVALAAAVVVFFPAAILNEQTAARLTDYLVRRLGPDAICAKVGIGFSSATLEGIVLPFDTLGSKLEVEKIEVTLDPLVALSQPRSPERIIKSIRVFRPALTLVTGSGTDTTAQGRPRKFSTGKIFETLGEADSLHSFTFSGGLLVLQSGDSCVKMLEQASGYLKRNPDGSYAVRLEGHGASMLRYGVSADGVLYADEKRAQVDVAVNIAEGDLPVSPTLPLSVSSNGGDGEFVLRLRPDGLSLSGATTLHSVQVIEHEREWFVPELVIELSDSTATLVEAEFSGPGVAGSLNGALALDREMNFSLTGMADVQLQEFLRSLNWDAATTGAAQLSFDVAGNRAEWLARVEVVSDSLRAFGVSANAVALRARMTDDSLWLDSLAATTPYGALIADAEVAFRGAPTLVANARLSDFMAPKLFGINSVVSEVTATARGEIMQPDVALSFRDSDSNEAARAVLTLADEQLDLNFSSPRGDCHVNLHKDSTRRHVTAEDIQSLLAAIYPDLTVRGEEISSSLLNFSGDAESGELFVELVGADSSALSGIASELSFNGLYSKESDEAYKLEGKWSGTGGDGLPFTGEGIVHAGADWLDIEKLFVDEFGIVSGSYDFAQREADISVSIDRLPLARIPYASRVVERLRLGGVLTGEFRARGELSALAWNANLNLVDGTAAGVPGFWGVLSASGLATRADSLDLSFGRGVRSILHARGHVNLKQDSLDVRADFVEADCADFLLALTGAQGLLSGNLAGEVQAFGRLGSPELLGSLRVTEGELLGEIYVDEFALDAVAGADESGDWRLAIPRLSITKNGFYSFSGELAAHPVKGGDFSAMLIGEGDFLDLLEQVDADFTSLGSESELKFEFGGTWDRPSFGGGGLSVNNGVFTYPPAAPGELGMNIQFHLNQTGTLDQGKIEVNSAEDSLIVDFLTDVEARELELLPLVIPSPRVTLGVIRLQTSEDGIGLRLPGFMKPEWLGVLTTGTDLLSPVYISALDSTRLAFSGEVNMRDSRFTFPFFRYGGARIRPVTKWLVDRLFEAQWALDVSLGSGIHYDVEVTGFKDSDLFRQLGGSSILAAIADYIDHISLDAVVTPTSEALHLHGSLMDSSFFVLGNISATTGTADYLDQTFFVDELRADFDETDIMPVLSGRAETYGVDSVGRTVPVYLTIYEIDPETNTRLPQGRFEDITYVLEADGYTNPEAVLALLGYDFTNLGEGKAEQVLARTAFSAAKRAWLDPISRTIEKSTFLDVFTLNPGGGVSPSLFRQQRENVLTDTLQSQGVIKLLKGSHVTVGKYLAPDLFVTYTGELSEAADRTEGDRLGLIHFWNLQYRVEPVSPDFLIDFAVEYDEANRRRDESISLKYSFTLEP